jgi:hypothetical protein
MASPKGPQRRDGKKDVTSKSLIIKQIEKDILSGKKKAYGRPSTYNPDYEEMLIEHMSNGLSFECFGATIDTALQTVKYWKETIPTFMDAYNLGKAKRRLRDEKLLEEYNRGTIKGGNHNTLLFKMRAMHGVTDDVIGKRKLQMLQLDNMTPEEIRALAIKLLQVGDGSK